MTVTNLVHHFGLCLRDMILFSFDARLYTGVAYAELIRTVIGQTKMVRTQLRKVSQSPRQMLSQAAAGGLIDALSTSEGDRHIECFKK